jgi:hypothetical protein
MSPEQIAAAASAVVAILGALTALIIALVQLNSKVQKTHDAVNSRMEEMLALTRASSLAQGKLAGPDVPPAEQSAPYTTRSQ